MRGAGQKFGGGSQMSGLYPITELESENHTSMHQYNRNMGQQQSNGGYRNPQSNYGGFNQQQQPRQTYQNVRDENMKYQDLEKIFSDTDDSASRLNDSILDNYDDLVPKQNQQQFSQNVLNQYQNYKTQTSRDFQKNNYGGNPYGYNTDKSLDLTLNLTKNYNSNNMILGGIHENSINESLVNIVNELDGEKNRNRHLQSQNGLNDTQVMYQKYEDTVKMMSQLQKQLGSSIDSNQASMLRSDRFRISLDSTPNGGGNTPQGLSNIPNNGPKQNQVPSHAIGVSPTRDMNFNKNTNYTNQNLNYQNQNNNIQQNKYNDFSSTKNLQSPPLQPITSSSAQVISSENRFNQNNINNNGFNNGLTSQNQNQQNNQFSYNYNSSQQQNLQLNGKGTLMNSNAIGNFSSPNSTKSQSGASSQNYQSPQSLQSSNFSGYQNPGMNSQQRRVFNQQQKVILKQAEQRVQSTVDPFLYQKRMENEILSDRNYQKMVEEELPVFCINCEEYIKITDVDRHAERECEVIQKRKEQQKKNPYLQQSRVGQSADQFLNDISEKIQQLEQQIIQRQQKLRSLPQTQPVVQLIQVSDTVLRSAQSIRLNNDNTSQIQQQIQIINNARSQISAQNDKNIGMLILWDRVIFLGDEKSLKVRYYKERGVLGGNDQNQIQNREIQQLEQELRKLDGMTQKERENVQYWKMQSEMMEQIKRQDINNLKYVKDAHQYQLVKNLQSEKDSETQSSVGFSSGTSDFGLTNHIQVVNPITQNAEDRKKIFFSEALSVKYKLPINHPGRQISMQDLYETAQKLNIPQQKWPEFIHNKMYSMG